MQPDFYTAAEKALEIRSRFGSEMEPLCILKHMPFVVVCSFADAASKTGNDRDTVLAAFRESQDAVSIYSDHKYFVVYNQKLPFEDVRMALARELGHIVLGHDGTRPEDVRQEEAEQFARTLLQAGDTQ